MFHFEPLKEVYKEKFIKAYKNVTEKWHGKAIEEMPEMKDFFIMKDSTLMPDRFDTRYMSIDKKEYQKGMKTAFPLPKIQAVVWK